MSIVIDLNPQAEAAIEAYAAAAHMEPGQFLSQWATLLADYPELAKTVGQAHDQGKREAIFSRAIEIEAMRRDIEEFNRKHQLRSLPDEAVTREAMYRDHD